MTSTQAKKDPETGDTSPTARKGGEPLCNRAAKIFFAVLILTVVWMGKTAADIKFNCDRKTMSPLAKCIEAVKSCEAAKFARHSPEEPRRAMVNCMVYVDNNCEEIEQQCRYTYASDFITLQDTLRWCVHVVVMSYVNLLQFLFVEQRMEMFGRSFAELATGAPNEHVVMIHRYKLFAGVACVFAALYLLSIPLLWWCDCGLPSRGCCLRGVKAVAKARKLSPANLGLDSVLGAAESFLEDPQPQPQPQVQAQPQLQPQPQPQLQPQTQPQPQSLPQLQPQPQSLPQLQPQPQSQPQSQLQLQPQPQPRQVYYYSQPQPRQQEQPRVMHYHPQPQPQMMYLQQLPQQAQQAQTAVHTQPPRTTTVYPEPQPAPASLMYPAVVNHSASAPAPSPRVEVAGNTLAARIQQLTRGAAPQQQHQQHLVPKRTKRVRVQSVLAGSSSKHQKIGQEPLLVWTVPTGPSTPEFSEMPVSVVDGSRVATMVNGSWRRIVPGVESS